MPAMSDALKPLDRSRRKRLSQISLAGVLLFGASVWVSLNVWTAPIGLIWHLFHGNFASFDGHSFRVPWDMRIHRSADQTITISREAPKYRLLRSPWGIMLIQHIPGPPTDMSKNYASIARANEQIPSGYQRLALHQIAAAKGTGYCWELVRLDSSYLSVSCWFDKDTLAAAYGGSPAYRDEFYRALALVSEAPVAHP